MAAGQQFAGIAFLSRFVRVETMTVRAPACQAEFLFVLGEIPRLKGTRGRVDKLLGWNTRQLRDSPGPDGVWLPNLFHREDADIAHLLFGGSDGPGSGTMPVRLRDASGRVRCLLAEFSKTSSPEGQELRLTLREPNREDLAAQCIPAEFQTLLENTTESFFFKNRNHVFVGSSSRFQAELAAALNGRELTGLTDYDLLAEPVADRFYAWEKQVLSSGEPFETVLHLDRPGRMFDLLSVRYYPVTSPGGEILGLFVATVNLTERVRAEEYPDDQLTEVRTGTYVLDLRQGTLAMSAALHRDFGIDDNYPHDLRGWERLVHPDDFPQTVEYLQTVLNAPGRLFDREYRIIRPSDNAVRWVHGLGRVERAADGTPLVMRGTVEDITERKATEAALRETKDRLQLFIEHAPAALAMFDRDMRYLSVSERWEWVYGISRDGILGQCHYDVIPQTPERWKQMHQRGIRGESLRSDEDRFYRADGVMLWVRWELLPWKEADGQVGGILLLVEDITEARQARERLRLAATVFEHASEGIVVLGLAGEVMEVNQAFTAMTRYERQEIVGRTLQHLRSDRHHAEFYGHLAQSLRQQGRWTGEIWLRSKDSSPFAVSATFTTVHGTKGDPQYYVGFFSDLTAMKQQEEKLQHVVCFDSLTGLPNRALLVDRLRQAMDRARDSHRMLAVVYIDLDNFKAVNDRFGKEISDALLVSVAARMEGALREEDVLGRLGGDEFVAILPNLAGIDSARPVIDGLLQAAAEIHGVGEHEIRISATAGAAFYPQPQDIDADQLVRHADQAMYEAKIAGKGSYQFFDSVRDRTVRGRHEELARIRQALKAGEFILYYQPKVNMATGALVGAEALIRWHHPERGIIPPAMFLPLIEEDPLAVEIGEWVIDAVLAQLSEWCREGREIRVSVNISAKQLQQPDFIERLSAILAKHPEVSPSLLGLEVLESSALQDVAMVSGFIRACSRMGIFVALDDFGTGYSSLTYLKRLPAQVLKIDQSFVRDMLDDTEDLAILQGILSLASAFGRTPVAEGVESVGHGVILLRLGCQIAQGYGIARPMPADELFPWFAKWKPDPSWAGITQVSPLEWPLLTAEVEQGAWLRALTRFLHGESTSPPEMDEARCRFGLWLEAQFRTPGANYSALQVIDYMHRERHRLGRRAIVCKEQGKMPELAMVISQIIELRTHSELQLRLLRSHGARENKDIQRVSLTPAAQGVAEAELQ